MPPMAQALPATITINSAVTVSSFIPISIFGNNIADYDNATDVTNTQNLVQGAGNFFLGYAGGSGADYNHWNGTGSYDSHHYWIPSGTTYSPGFDCLETYSGTDTQFGFPSNITDGNSSTAWLSNVDTDFPNHQWVELDFNSQVTVNAVTIAWGTPYAASFQIQNWTSAGSFPLYSGQSESHWATIGTYTGTPGTQGVTFPPVSSWYYRILMTASSAGVSGAYSIAEVMLYDADTQVTVNTSSGVSQTQVEVSSTDPGNSPNTGWTPPLDFERYMTYVHSFSPHAIPMVAVNLGTGTAQEAASWVYYANIVRGYDIKYWEIGNETEGQWEPGGPLPAEDFVRRYIEYYEAMKAVDPSILVLGPVSGSFFDNSNMYDGKGYVQDFIGFLHAKGDDSYINGIDFHWFPNYGTYTASQALASTSTLDAYPASLNSWLSGVAGGATIPVFVSQFNEDAFDANGQVQLLDGLWVADSLGHLITDFGARGSANYYAVFMLGEDAATNPAGGDMGYLCGTSGAYQYQPHASYWAMRMMAVDWAIPGDTNHHQLLSTTVGGVPVSLFAAYSDYRPDGVVSLAVVNKDPANAYNTRITGLPFTPNSTASGWTFDSSNYQWVNTGAMPYHAAPDTAPTAVTLTGVSGSFPVTFQPYSITVLRFTNSGQPTLTSTPTPTFTATPTGTWFTATITPTPTHSPTCTPNEGPVTLVDDFEDLSRDGVPPPAPTCGAEPGPLTRMPPAASPSNTEYRPARPEPTTRPSSRGLSAPAPRPIPPTSTTPAI